LESPVPVYLSAYLMSLVLVIAIDLVWLGVVARSFYAAQLGDLLRPQPGLLAAAIFYAIYAFGLVHFAVQPGLRAGGWVSALGHGALLGFIAYSTYDLSNLATLKGWPIGFVVVDIAWGTALSAVVAAMTCAVIARFSGP
jgi:uncharacterized membrane protein